ncbi:MAG: chromosome segregation protein SMC [Actinomycetota bacterium]|nr:chromosome segregation protein SMC [Actinomycetota bacterium]
MLLKKLALIGFKSFADRTRLEFDAGVNVVVGPNGAGKSNLLDAIAWVMGTQATSALRTEKMEDVVFAGTATRPAVSRAEVSLTFDNSDGFLPVDLNEITITRRLYRDGTSEYEMNRTPCRLLDIQELLSDGGVGRRQHVLVSQGQIGSVLTARPDEHRAVIEEAAGITKHRGRRDRAIRRLRSTDQDVDRLNDILAEKRRALRPLKRQANAAARHGSVKAEAKALRLWLGGEAIRDLRSRNASAAAEQATLSEEIDSDGHALESLLMELTGLRASAGDVGAALERDTTAAARLETVVERLRRYGLVARERRVGLEGRIEGAEERRDDLTREEVELATGIDEATDAELRLGDEAERRAVALQALEDEERALAEQVQLPAEGLVANLRGDLRALENASQRDGRELESIKARRSVVVDRLEEETTESVELNRSIQQADSEVTASQRTYEEARDHRTDVEEKWEHADRQHTDALLAVAAAEARVEAYEAAIAGIGDPAARRMAEDREGIRGVVAASLDAPAELADAVDRALGSWADAFLADDRTTIRGLTGDLKSNGLGGVSLVSPPQSADVPARGAAAELGLDALVDLLGEKADREVADALLGDVVFAAGWEAAWRVVERYPRLRAVTPEGDVIAASGMHVAQPDGTGFAALEAARVDLEVGEHERSRTESRRTAARRDFETALRIERTALDDLEALEARIAGHTEALALIGRARAEGEAERERLDTRTAALREAEGAREERIAEARERVAEFEGEEAVRQAAWDALNRRREDVTARRDEARRRREESTGELAGVSERRALLQRRFERVGLELGQLDLLPEDDPRIDQLSEIESRSTRVTTLAQGHIAELRDRQRTLRLEVGDVSEALESAEQRRERLESAISTGKERLSVLAIELAEIRVRMESSEEGLRRDADASLDEALGAPRPELDEATIPSERLASLEADLRRMGPINPLASAEYEELAGDVALLDEQLVDLDESRSELRKVITALDDEMASLFMVAFDEIAVLYQENFSQVFPGGRGRLRLTDPDHPLESGVEVEAQPHGKKVGRLALLSGGERSLAALAFLFAVFRARPSPFYVLDEVEAALDDANLHRFLRLVDTLRSSAQLVIITHQQQTMEAADMLYGVTMEPGESSRVLARRMTRVSV